MNFRKKDVLMILVGIVFLALELVIKIGNIRIDIFSDIVAYVLILIGISGMTARNNLFKKCRSTAFTGLIVSVLIQGVNCMNLGEFTANASLFTKGVATIIFIYMTYYFTEGVALEAKMQDKAAVSRNFKITWIVFGAFIFGYYIVLNFNLTNLIDVLVQAVLVICSIYYAYVIAGAANQLYMEGLPKHAMES